MTPIKIEHGIPLPNKRGIEVNDVSGILKRVNVGDSFLVDDQNIANSFRGVAPRLGMKLTGRKQDNGKVRLWRIE